MSVISFVEKSKSERGGEANGYVAVPMDHPLHGVYHWSIESKYGIKVHNGVTYSSSAYERNAVTERVDIDIPETYWILGFHTQEDADNKENWCLENVLKELESFKNQIEAVKETKE